MQNRNSRGGHSPRLALLAGVIVSLAFGESMIAAQQSDSSQSSNGIEMVDFGTVAVGSSIVQSRTFQTAGLGPILITGDFGQTNDCESPGVDRCTISITFKPTQLGLRSGILLATARPGFAQRMFVLYGSG